MALENMDFFKQGASLFPQPVAMSCGRICRARSDLERLDAIIKSAEILTRYLAAVSVGSLSAGGNGSDEGPEAFNSINGALSFGDFLSIIQTVTSYPDTHPLKSRLQAGFKSGKKGKPAPTNDALIALLELRNRLGHSLQSLSDVKVATVFDEDGPHIQLQNALQGVDFLLRLPLFLIEEINVVNKQFVARRLVLMGDGEPIPEQIIVTQPIDDRVLCVGTPDGAVSLDPFLIWAVAPQRSTRTVYLLHSVKDKGLVFKTVLGDEQERDDRDHNKLIALFNGHRRGMDPAESADGTTFYNEWNAKRKVIEHAIQSQNRTIPWADFDEDILGWYGRHLGITDDRELRAVIIDRLLDGRDILPASEIDQLVVLFGKEDIVRRHVRRSLLDCRVRKNPENRWDERIENGGNILACLRIAISFFGQHIGIEGANVDGLTVTSGSANYIAMREALVNLFIHQDYTDQRTVAQIEITEHRSIFHNAGKALVSRESLIDGGRSQCRNPILARALRLIGFAEMAGSGLSELHRQWRHASRRPPKMDSDAKSNTFTLTLDWRSVPEDHDAFWLDKLGVKLTGEQAGILSLLSDPEGFSVEEIASARGLLLEDARSYIEYLTTQGLISENNSKYVIRDYLRELIGQT